MDVILDDTVKMMTFKKKNLSFHVLTFILSNKFSTMLCLRSL